MTHAVQGCMCAPQRQERRMRPMRSGTLSLLELPPVLNFSYFILAFSVVSHSPSRRSTRSSPSPLFQLEDRAGIPQNARCPCVATRGGRTGWRAAGARGRPAGEGPDGRRVLPSREGEWPLRGASWSLQGATAGRRLVPTCVHVFPGRRSERLWCGITEAPPRHLRGPKTQVSAGSVEGA
jgi:hypothetical protein